MSIEFPDANTVNFIASGYPVKTDELFSPDNRPDWVETGIMGRDDLLRVVEWKSQRQLANAGDNDETTVNSVSAEALKPFLRARSYRDVRHEDVLHALASFETLHGVKARMSSAILAVFRPDLFTVLDVRAWATLKHYREVGDRDLDKWTTYADYLDVCHELRECAGVSLRNLDRFLFTLNGQTHVDYIDARRREGLVPCSSD